LSDDDPSKEPSEGPDDEAAPPEDYEPFEHPINKRTIVELTIAVVVVAAIVLIVVIIAR